MNTVLRATPDGTTLATERLPGDGPLVMVLHGFTGDRNSMRPFAHALTPAYEVLLVDLVGHGESDSPEHLEPYRMPSVVDQALSLIADATPGSVHLVGYSMGGRVALSMAGRAPWFFGSVTTLSATAGIADPADRADRHDADLALADRIEAIGTAVFIAEWLGAELFRPLREVLGPAGVRREIEDRSQASMVGLANSLRGTGQGSMPPVWDGLDGLRAPLLAVAGALDPSYVQLANRLARSAPTGRAVTIEGCGHALPMEDHESVARVVLEFLEGLSGLP